MSSASVFNPWILNKCVLPQHTDHAGVMWHGAYLNWLEEARVEALRHVGLPYKLLSEEGFEMPVVSLNINYIRALLHGQNVLLESACLPRQLARWPWKTNFLCNGVVVAEAHVNVVLVKRIGDKHQLIRNIPHQFGSYFLKLQSGPKSN